MLALAAAGATGTASGHLPLGGGRLRPAVPAVLRLRRTARRYPQQAHRAGGDEGARSRRGRLGVGIVAFMDGRLEWMLVVLFLIALQSTFFSPAKYGIRPGDPSRTRPVARQRRARDEHVCGDCGSARRWGVSHSMLWHEQLRAVGLALVVVAIVGTVCSLGIPRCLPAAQPVRQCGPTRGTELQTACSGCASDRILWITVLGIAWFWFLGALLQIVVVAVGTQVMVLDDRGLECSRRLPQWGSVSEASLRVGCRATRWSSDLSHSDRFGMGLSAIVLSRCTSYSFACGGAASRSWASSEACLRCR